MNMKTQECVDSALHFGIPGQWAPGEGAGGMKTPIRMEGAIYTLTPKEGGRRRRGYKRIQGTYGSNEVKSEDWLMLHSIALGTKTTAFFSLEMGN